MSDKLEFILRVYIKFLAVSSGGRLCSVKAAVQIWSSEMLGWEQASQPKLNFHFLHQEISVGLIDISMVLKGFPS